LSFEGEHLGVDCPEFVVIPNLELLLTIGMSLEGDCRDFDSKSHPKLYFEGVVLATISLKRVPQNWVKESEVGL
jgi:hypothetical protein